MAQCHELALSKKDLMIHITMNKLYNTHCRVLGFRCSLKADAIDTFKMLTDSSHRVSLPSLWVSTSLDLMAMPEPDLVYGT